MKLGQEIGRAEGRQVRHRMFALVDRSAPVPIFPTEGQPPLRATAPVPGPGEAWIVPARMSKPSTMNGNYSWSIQPGMILRVTGVDSTGAAASEEVVVRAVTLTSFLATFTRAYPAGLTSISALRQSRAAHDAVAPGPVSRAGAVFQRHSLARCASKERVSRASESWSFRSFLLALRARDPRDRRKKTKYSHEFFLTNVATRGNISNQ